MKTIGVLCGLLLCSLNLFCQTTSGLSLGDTKKLSNTAMGLISSGDFEGAINVFQDHSVLSNVQIESIISQLKAQKDAIMNSLGQIRYTEYINEKRIGNEIIRYTYLSIHQKYALRWMFTFFKASEGWLLAFFSYDDKVNDMFSEN